MKLKTILAYPFKNWFSPILFSLVAFPVFLLSIFIDVGILQLIGGGLFFITVLWLFVSFIVLLFKGQWSKSFYTLLFIATMAMVIGLMN